MIQARITGTDTATAEFLRPVSLNQFLPSNFLSKPTNTNGVVLFQTGAKQLGIFVPANITLDTDLQLTTNTAGFPAAQLLAYT
ncbi:MAG: hypothetical protein ACREUY_04320 [Burkholderiales bacterium]